MKGLRLLAVAALLVPAAAGCVADAEPAAASAGYDYGGAVSVATAAYERGGVVSAASPPGAPTNGAVTLRPGVDGWLTGSVPLHRGGRPGTAANWFHDIGATIGRGLASEATDINDRGDIVGAMTLPGTQTTHAFIMNPHVDGGRVVDLTPGESRSSRAEAVNRLRTVVGTLGAPGGAQPQEPFVWNPRTGLQILPVPPGAAGGQAVDVNDRGTVLVVGVNATGVGMPVGSFLWDPVRRRYTPLPVLDSSPEGAVTIARTVDARGGVAGGIVTEVGEQVYQHTAVLWEPRTLTPRPLPTGGATDTFATDRNDHGMVVGWRITSPGGVSTAVYWPTPHSLPVELPGRVAFRVNNGGQIVGVRDLPDSPAFPFTAVMWEPRKGTAADLGDLGLGSYALGLNASGRSAGYAMAEHNGQYHFTAGWWERPRPQPCPKHCRGITEELSSAPAPEASLDGRAAA